MSDRVYGAEEKAKLERLVNEGVTVLQEIEDLNFLTKPISCSLPIINKFSELYFFATKETMESICTLENGTN